MPILIPIAIVAGAVYGGYKAYTRRKQQHIPRPPRPVRRRQKQLQAFTSTPSTMEPSEAEQRINQRLGLAAVGLGLASVGTLVWRPLTLIRGKDGGRISIINY